MTQSVDYYVLTQLLLDDIYFPTGESKLNQLGGGTYTVAGMRIWSDRVGFCCAPGCDYEGNYDKWFLDNQICISGGRREKNCTHARLNYFPDGEREEILLPGCATHRESQPLVSEIPPEYRDCRGMYFFKDCEQPFWDELLPFLTHGSAISCWEIFGASACPQNRDFIGDVLHHIDLFSLNLTEGRHLTGLSEPLEIVKALRNLNARNFIFRMGANGAIAASPQKLYHIPAVATDVVNVTGGGNSSTGGFTVGFCESDGDILEAGLCAAVASSFIIEQYGVPAHIDDHLMQQARQRRDALRTLVKPL